MTAFSPKFEHNENIINKEPVSKKTDNFDLSKKYTDIDKSTMDIKNYLINEQLNNAIENIEKSKTIEDEDIKKEIDSISDKKEKNSLFEFFTRWGKRGLVIATLLIGSKSVQESSADYDFSSPEPDGKTEYVKDFGEKEFEFPEITIYGHRDEKTDSILNALSGNISLEQKFEIQKERNIENYESRLQKIKDVYEKRVTNLNNFSHYITDDMFNVLLLKDGSDEQRKKILEEYILEENKYIKSMKNTDPNKSFLAQKTNEETTVVDGLIKNDVLKNTNDSISYWKNISFDKFSKDSHENFWKDIENEFSAERYEKVWTLHFKNGNPNIRSLEKDDGDASNSPIREFLDTDGNAYYDVLTNTMYIPTEQKEPVLHTWLAELAHAKQFNEKPLLSTLRSAVGFLATFPNYNYQYDIPGTVEYEAHKEIQPKLTNIVLPKDNDVKN